MATKTRLPPPRLALAAACLAWTTAASLAAQPVVLVPTGAAPAAEASESAPRRIAADRAVRPSDNVAIAAAETGVLRRLPSLGRSTKLAGEHDEILWPIYLTAAEAAARPRLRLTHVAAVSVMPEASRLTVSVDDRPVGSFPVSANGAARTVEVTLPTGALHAGWNALRVVAEQRHRVECSTASTYELWTEIDRAHSGLVFADGFAPERRSLADLADVSPDETGRVRLRLVVGQDPDPARLDRLLRLAQAIAIAGGWLDPVVSIRKTPGTGPGVDVLIGAEARGALPATAELPSDVVALLDDPDPSRLVLAVPEDAATLDRVIGQIAQAGRELEGSEAGRLARRTIGGRVVEGGEISSFADLGATSTEFTGRLFRTAVDLRLPADFYPADYAKVALNLAGGHAPGLDRKSRLTIRVNGRQIAGAPLSAHAGEIFADRLIELPLSAFRPGRNRLEIEASVPHPDDQACDAAVQIDAGKRFLFVDQSRLTFPTFARAARLPDLAASAAGVFAALDPATRPKIWAPRPDPETLAAIATLTTRIAVADGRLGAPEIAFRNPPTDAPSAWVIGAFSDLPATVSGAVGVEPVAVHDAWRRRPAAFERVSDVGGPIDPVARRAAALRLAALEPSLDPIVTGTLQFRPLAEPGRKDLVDEWRRSIESPWSPAAFLRGAETRLRRSFEPVLGAEAPLPRFAPRATTGVVFAQALSPNGGVWTLTTAATAAALAEGVEALTEGDRWASLSGDVVAWDKASDEIETGATKPRGFFMTASPTPGNLRLIAAGWIGEHPIVFALMALAATGLLGFATARLLPHVGVRA
ncbi:MAG: cellulose biosynthesis cyclic di-GMP-binding regulatory protein BcsB [Hyphomicrobiales bacterium]|nr:cellulose biosynthesis cyclic di-GMP-binding regulatory protein BcsB [Hyphomicrobiales bacterium]